jgi:tRNA1Val (adenine37-N6)-methyltransferase
MKVTEDRFLDGSVIVKQPARGFRAGLDAVMLAAGVPARDGDEVLELGAGVGTASLCLASRVRCSVIGVEIDEGLATLANENATVNGMAGRVSFVTGDALAPPKPLRLAFDHVFCNPPFHDAHGRSSPDAGRARAKQDAGSLKQWFSSGLKCTNPKGTFTIIIRADRLAEVLAALPVTGLRVLPLWPARGEPASRVIIQCRSGSRAPMALLPGLTLHENGGNTPDAEAILRGRACLARHFTGL